MLVGLFIFVAGSEAQTTVPDFLVEEGTPPPGANVPCEPTAEHPYPVVLVHGTFETMDQNWAVLSPELKGMGYCVFALNYGNRGLNDIKDSARELGVFVDNVLGYTGAEKVSLVGHSQGGMMPRYWIKNLGGKKKVEDLVGIAPSNYGTELEQVDFQAVLGIPNPCRACEQQQAGSEFITKLNRGDDTRGKGSFTQIATDDDEIIIPYTRCFCRERSGRRTSRCKTTTGDCSSPTRTSTTTRSPSNSSSTPWTTRVRPFRNVLLTLWAEQKLPTRKPPNPGSGAWKS